MDILHAAAAATHVAEEEIIDVDVRALEEAVAGPELHRGLGGDYVADGGPGFGDAELRALAGIIRRIGVVEGQAHLRAGDGAGGRAVGAFLGIRGEDAGYVPVLAKGQFAVVLGLVAQAVLGQRARGLKADLRAALAVSPVTRANIAGDINKVLQNLLNPLLEIAVGGLGKVAVQHFAILLELLLGEFPAAIDSRLPGGGGVGAALRRSCSNGEGRRGWGGHGDPRRGVGARCGNRGLDSLEPLIKRPHPALIILPQLVHLPPDVLDLGMGGGSLGGSAIGPARQRKTDSSEQRCKLHERAIQLAPGNALAKVASSQTSDVKRET